MSPKKWIIKDLLQVTTDYLREKEIENPRLCAEVLLAHQLNTSRIKLYLSFDQPLNERDIEDYRSLIRRRVNREPTQYITGIQEFWSMEFMVGPGVLIPRPESEILVEQAVRICRNRMNADCPGYTILDLGTGSGAIAIAISQEVQEATVWASDISGEALDRAEMNARKHGVEGRIRFFRGDLFQPFKDKPTGFDVIVSNPPYIASLEFDSLQPEVREYEPRQALDGREGGLFFIDKIIREGPDYLNPGGWLLIEMDPGQVSTTLKRLEETGQYVEKYCIKDHSKKDRVVIARRTTDPSSHL